MTFGGARRKSFPVSGYGLVEFGLDLTPDLIRAETHRAGGGQPGLFYCYWHWKRLHGDKMAILKQ